MDFDRRTGARLTNFQSALQSVEIILTKRLGTVVMLREFGGASLDLLGRKLTPKLVPAFFLLVAASIDLWEPRFRVRAVRARGTVEEVRMGQLGLSIEVEWRPRAHLGDPTVEEVRGITYENGRITGGAV